MRTSRSCCESHQLLVVSNHPLCRLAPGRVLVLSEAREGLRIVVESGQRKVPRFAVGAVDLFTGGAKFKTQVYNRLLATRFRRRPRSVTQVTGHTSDSRA